MHYQDQVISLTKEACENLYRTVRAAPADHLRWNPMDRCASILELFQECAPFPRGIAAILRARSVPPLNREDIDRLEQEKASLRTVEQCESACRVHTADLLVVIGEFAADYLDDEIYLPIGGGREYSMAEIMLLHYRNIIYHAAQIDYVRTLW
ncbi:MAG TPA: hypothetical protein VNA16_00680 [Abditibacteriaceae bacterium]|nr:hypothetical protein [Abditibacteriaceae bacterium]